VTTVVWAVAGGLAGIVLVWMLWKLFVRVMSRWFRYFWPH
jgi:hypothetical protein